MAGLWPVGVVATGLAPTETAGVTLTGSITEAADTLSGVSVVVITAAATPTDAADSLTGSAAVGSPLVLVFPAVGMAATGLLEVGATTGGGGVGITSSITEAADSLTGEVGAAVGYASPVGTAPVGLVPTGTLVAAPGGGTSGVFVSGSPTEAADTLSSDASAGGSNVQLSASITEVADATDSSIVEAADTLTGAASVASQSGGGATEAVDTLSSTFVVRVTTTVIYVENADGVASTVNVVAAGGTAMNASITEVADAAWSAINESPDTASNGAATVPVGVSAPITETADTAASLVSVVSDVLLDASILEAADTVASDVVTSPEGSAVFNAPIVEAEDTATGAAEITGEGDAPPVVVEDQPGSGVRRRRRLKPVTVTYKNEEFYFVTEEEAKLWIDSLREKPAPQKKKATTKAPTPPPQIVAPEDSPVLEKVEAYNAQQVAEYLQTLRALEIERDDEDILLALAQIEEEV